MFYICIKYAWIAPDINCCTCLIFVLYLYKFRRGVVGMLPDKVVKGGMS